MTIHTKSVLVDDAWALIGSTNIMRRSLYTDLEHAVAFVDPEGRAVREYRCALWADHFRVPAATFGDVDAGLNAWEPTWGTPGSLRAPTYLVQRPLPLQPDAPLVGKDLEDYDSLGDVDSRQPSGGLCPPRRDQPGGSP